MIVYLKDDRYLVSIMCERLGDLFRKQNWFFTKITCLQATCVLWTINLIALLTCIGNFVLQRFVFFMISWVSFTIVIFFCIISMCDLLTIIHLWLCTCIFNLTFRFNAHIQRYHLLVWIVFCCRGILQRRRSTYYAEEYFGKISYLLWLYMKIIYK